MNASHLEIVKSGSDAIRDWRSSHPNESLELSEADLSEFNLAGVDLSGANLSGCILRGADLSQINLAGADLSDANLSRCNLRDADFTNASLEHANLEQANLTGARLTGANLRGAKLSSANLTSAELLNTSLAHATTDSAKLTNAVFRDTSMTPKQAATFLPNVSAYVWLTAILLFVLFLFTLGNYLAPFLHSPREDRETLIATHEFDPQKTATHSTVIRETWEFERPLRIARGQAARFVLKGTAELISTDLKTGTVTQSAVASNPAACDSKFDAAWLDFGQTPKRDSANGDPYPALWRWTVSPKTDSSIAGPQPVELLHSRLRSEYDIVTLTDGHGTKITDKSEFMSFDIDVVHRTGLPMWIWWIIVPVAGALVGLLKPLYERFWTRFFARDGSILLPGDPEYDKIATRIGGITKP